MRIHTSPSIQITEIDKSQYSPSMTGTKVYIRGFTQKGEPYKPVDITSRSAFITIFGEPTTEAERYAYACVCETLNNQGQVCFARLPYDNDSFEKLVGFKYNVSDKKTGLENSSWKTVHENDNEINEYCEITGAKDPILYDLTKIEEYRTDEDKVAPNSFLIVDTTGATYSKVTEDSRKGVDRELIGIVPVVTTAANALYAQSLIQLGLDEVSAYEPLAGTKLNTLKFDRENDGTTELSNAGLSCVDFVKRINTVGKFENVTQLEVLTQQYSGDKLSSFATRDAAEAYLKTLSEAEKEEYQVAEQKTIATLSAKFYEEVEDQFKYNFYWASSTNPSQDAINKIDDLNTAFGAEKYIYACEKDLVSHVSGDVQDAMADFSEAIKKGIGYDPVKVVDTSKEAKAAVRGYASEADRNAALALFGEYKKNNYAVVSNTAAAVDNAGTVYKVAIVTNERQPQDLTSLALLEPEKADYYAQLSGWHGVDGDDSVPETLALDAANYFSTIQPASDGVGFDPEHLKDIGVVVYKTYLDPSEGNKVSYEPVEAYCGSLFKEDKDPNTGVTKFIDTIINSQSQYINFFSNCFSSTKMKNAYKKDLDILIAAPSEGASLGLFEDMTKKYISISKSIYDGFNKSESKVTDINARDIDIVPDAGVSNIASYLKAIYGDKGEYDLSITDDIGNPLIQMWKAVDPTSPAMKTWKTVEQKLDNFCKNVRKDCMFIADGPRPLVLQGQKKIIRDSKPANTLDKDIIPYLKVVAGLNTSYGAGYLDWFEQADDYTGDFFWCPPSIKATGVYINTDVNFNYWDAPAGLNRGIIAATDVAFSPTASQADLIYDKCWNYAVNYPNDGIVLEGQKTLQTKPTALDRINVRRLMLRLERATGQALRWFLYEGNTAYTRQRAIDAIDPYFKAAMVGGGLYDYKIICDESNNTPQTIDANELHISIGVKPVKTIEFIMVDFVIGSTGASWAELGL